MADPEEDLKLLLEKEVMLMEAGVCRSVCSDWRGESEEQRAPLAFISLVRVERCQVWVETGDLFKAL